MSPKVNSLHIDAFSERLKIILTQELAKGNKISETSQGWPATESIMIFLAHPFHANYQIADVIYREVNDRHYWKAEYIDESTYHIIACGF